MECNLILITEENKADFTSVLPEVYAVGPMRTSIGAYNEEGEVLGAASTVFLNDSYELDWLFVEPGVRRQGVATKLNNTLFGTLFSGGRYPVFARFIYESWEPGLYEFFLSREYTDVAYSHDRFLVSPKELAASRSSLRRPGKQVHQEKEREQAFFELDDRAIGDILLQLSEEGLYQVEDYVKWKGLCVPELCRCTLDEEGKLINLIFVQKDYKYNILELSFLYSRSVKGLYVQIDSALRNVHDYYSGVYVRFDAINPQAKKMADSLFPKATREPVYVAEW